MADVNDFGKDGSIPLQFGPFDTEDASSLSAMKTMRDKVMALEQQLSIAKQDRDSWKSNFNIHKEASEKYIPEILKQTNDAEAKSKILLQKNLECLNEIEKLATEVGALRFEKQKLRTALVDAVETICSEYCTSKKHHILCQRPREALK